MTMRYSKRCACGKRSFPDRIAAELILLTREQHEERRERTEVRSYRCPKSGAWHLTSKGSKKNK